MQRRDLCTDHDDPPSPPSDNDSPLEEEELNLDANTTLKTTLKPRWEDLMTAHIDIKQPLTLPPTTLHPFTRKPLPCPFNPHSWLRALQNYPNRAASHAILNAIRQGARICFNPTPTSTFTSPSSIGSDNLPLPPGREDEAITFVDNELQADITNGRRIGPFDPHLTPFTNYRLSPCGVATKKHSTKLRLIHHLSWPRPPGTSRHRAGPDSVNGNITELDCKLTTFDDAIKLINQHRNQQSHLHMIKIDIKAAYRCIPVNPIDQPLLALQWRNKIYFDLALTFGGRSSCSIWEVFATAIDWIIQDKCPSIRDRLLHYIDDFFGLTIGTKEAATLTLQQILAILALLGVPISAEKVEGPARILSFLGITIDLDANQIRLDETKLSATKALIKQWLNRTTCTLKELDSLAGSLYWTTKVVRGGRTFLRRIVDEKCKRIIIANRKRGPQPISEETREDLRWWDRFLTKFNGVTAIPDSEWTPGSPSPDNNPKAWTLATDACADGFGARWNNHYISGQWTAHQRQLAQRDKGLAISTLELAAIVIAANTWGKQWQGKRILIECDNTAAVSAINTGSCHNQLLMSLTRELWYVCCRFEFELRAVHIPGLTNIDADLLSRNRIDLFLQRHPSLTFFNSVPAMPNSLPSVL